MFEQLARRFVKGWPQTEDPDVQQNLILFSTVLGVILNLALAASKMVIGWLMHSLAIFSDGVNNLSDTLGSLVGAVGSWLSKRPSDEEHPFGHGRFEYLASFVVSFIILYVAVELLRRGITLILTPEPLGITPVAAVLMLLSIAVKIWMYRYNRMIDKRIQSTLNDGIAKDAMNDVAATTGVLLSIVLFLGFRINVDGIATVLLALFVGKNGWELARDTANTLLGEAPDETLVVRIGMRIMDGDHILGYHDLMVHDYGRGNTIASVHVVIPDDISVTELHRSIDAVEKRVLEELHVQLVIHMDPVSVMKEAYEDPAL